MIWRELYAERKAIIVTAVFASTSGALGFLTSEHPWPALVAFHVILITNTYFSIYRFALITPPQDLIQKVTDLSLAALYLVLACLFDRPEGYLLIISEIFFLALLKWFHLVYLSGWTSLLKRKIKIDTFGFIACLLAFWGVAAGYTQPALIIWSIIFGLANIYLLIFRPMYRANG